jgi:hypothetical protein
MENIGYLFWGVKIAGERIGMRGELAQDVLEESKV